jgi:transposase InsO family protein
MPWREVSIVEQRLEFVALAEQEGANRRELCRRFAISATTGYKWLRRAREHGPRKEATQSWASDRSRRPHRSPDRAPASLETAVLQVRDAHPAWGARKIRRCLERAHGKDGGLAVPAASTVHEILSRHGRIVPTERAAAPGRFEHPQPNLVWQMDFKGRTAMQAGRWCHPLTVVDDHSRYAVCLQACGDETGATVRQRLERVFRRYGLPEAFLVDNGTPWGNLQGRAVPGGGWTRLGVWLLKLGVGVIHSRPYHPQTRGKNERFHRTLKAELLALRRLRDLDHAQADFDRWRHCYNHERPHQALGFDVPASRYRPSPRAMPASLPEPPYAQGDILRRVGTTKGYVSFKGRLWRVGEAFCGETLAIRPHATDGCFAIFFASHKIGVIDLRDPDPALPQNV